jgi:hypothetical protein
MMTRWAHQAKGGAGLIFHHHINGKTRPTNRTRCTFIAALASPCIGIKRRGLIGITGYVEHHIEMGFTMHQLKLGSFGKRRGDTLP